MTEWEPVDGGKSGARVWRGQQVHRMEGNPGEIAAEAERLLWLATQGIPCPEVVQHETGVLVTTTLPGRSAAQPWPAKMRLPMVDAIADVLWALHGLPVAGCPFNRMLAVTIPAAERAISDGDVDLNDLDPARIGWSGSQLLAELQRTRPLREEPVVNHGDPCLANLIFSENGSLSGVIDVGRLGVPDRYNDLAVATRSVAGKWHPRYGERLMQRYGIGVDHADEAKIRFYRLLDEFF